MVNKVQGLLLHPWYEEYCQCRGCLEMSTTSRSTGQRLLFGKAENLPSEEDLDGFFHAFANH